MDERDEVIEEEIATERERRGRILWGESSDETFTMKTTAMCRNEFDVLVGSLPRKRRDRCSPFVFLLQNILLTVKERDRGFPDLTGFW